MRLGSLLFLIVVLFVLAVEWDVIIDYVDKVTKQVGLKSPAYLLTVLEKESGFAKNIGDNLGSKEKNIQRCVDMCYYTPGINNVDGRILTKCYNWTKGEFTINLRKSWCEDQYKALEKIVERLKLDINKVPFSPDFGIGYAQFQPPTWESYPELKNKNPWNLEDSIYAAAIKMLKDGVHKDEYLAIEQYNRNPKYIEKFIEARQEWDQIISDTIFVFDCPSNDFSCGLARLKTEFDDCAENNWSIKRKKECIKTKVAQFKETKLANLEKEKDKLVLRLAHLQTLNSTAAILGFPELKIFQDEEVTVEVKNLPFLQNVSTETIRELEKITYKEEKIEQPPTQIIYKEERIAIEQKPHRSLEKPEVNLSSKSMPTTTKVIPATTTQNIPTTTIQTKPTLTQESDNKPKIVYGGGGSSPRKDPCDDYKNINYPNILISEIQFETTTDTKDEFIELYNPTDQEIDLTCWSLEKYAAKQEPTSTPTLTKLIPQSKFAGKIKPYSFFLITSSSTKEKYQGDLSYSGEYPYLIAINNVIILKKPSGEISDLVGYGDNPEKIYQFEGSPFIASSTNFENKSIQRKNLQDNNNNSDDFLLKDPYPENSNSPSRKPRTDFVDLPKIKIENLQVFTTSTEEEIILILSWNLNIPKPVPFISSTNYIYDLLISTSSDFNTFKLEDFGSTSSLPSSKFDSSTTTFETTITKCPTTSTLYYFGLYLKDLLDGENKTDLAIASTTLPEDLCNPESEEKTTSSSTTSTIKVLISEVKISGENSQDEYIELYNPNDFEIDLTGWRLEKINKNGTSTTLISSKTKLSKFDGVKIKPFSYLLIANASSTLDIRPDLVWSKSYNLAKDNAVRLINNNNELVDLVGWGEAPIFETEAFPENPNSSKVLLRKAGINSNEDSMNNKEKDYGNSYDTDNNKLDFILANPEPQNSFSTPEIPPDYPTDFNLTIDGQYLTIGFNSPYQKLPGSYYEIRINESELNDDEIKNNWQSLKKINLDLPEVKPYGEDVDIEMNACEQDIKNGNIFILGIVKDNNLQKFVKGEVGGLNCTIFESIGSEGFWWGQDGPTYVPMIAQEVFVNKKSFIKTVSVQLAKYRNPEDKLWIEIWFGGDKPETGSFLIKTNEVDGTYLTSDVSWIDFSLETGVILEPGRYFFVLKRSGLNSDNYYRASRRNDTGDHVSKLWHFLAVEGGWVYYQKYYPIPGLITRDLGIIIK